MMVPTPHSPEFEDLKADLINLAKANLDWVGDRLDRCNESDVFRWFIDPVYGGTGWTDAEIAEGYFELSCACLSTTFVITQRTGACKRIANSNQQWLKETYLPRLASGEIFATVGISHLTTSRRHLGKPVLVARRADGGFILDGYCPWVTGAKHADLLIIGANVEGSADNEVLLAVRSEGNGISFPDPPKLLALNDSQTGQVRFEETFVEERFLLAGPCPKVMSSGIGASTGGIQTSILALGVAQSAINYMQQQSSKRQEVASPQLALSGEIEDLKSDLLAKVRGELDCTNEALRTRVNSLVLRATQAAMAVAKGGGFVEGHPVGRWCKEALFFLVWSCPQPVVQANLCELAGIEME